MKLKILLATIGLALSVDARAQSLGSLADIAIIDRDTGVALSPHYYRGEYWVAGRPGAKYSIEVRNRLGERLLAVTSVDGINVALRRDRGLGSRPAMSSSPASATRSPAGARATWRWPHSPSPNHPIRTRSAPGGRRTSASSASPCFASVGRRLGTPPPPIWHAPVAPERTRVARDFERGERAASRPRACLQTRPRRSPGRAAARGSLRARNPRRNSVRATASASTPMSTTPNL